MTVAIQVQTKAEHVGQEAEVRTGEERDHVGQRRVPCAETSFRQCGYFESKTETVDRDIDQLNKDITSGPGAQQSMTVEEVWIGKVLGREESDPLPHRS